MNEAKYHNPTKAYDYAEKMLKLNDSDEALEAYYLLAASDPTLESGYIAMKIGQVYESRKMVLAARYWYGVAFDNNPEIEEYAQAHRKLEDVYKSFLQKIEEA